ncbi:MAG: formate dehydrogenase accessory sulfurtransferase FdhD [Dehalococcoidales bacterium]|nr:MAG: formate dehydrogenase accessory sulfurtransferase FdhD [Dehalococcoidales bacterium]
MENEIERIPVLRLSDGKASSIEDMVAREFPLTILLNDQEMVTLLCSPVNLNYLAVGFLYSEGFLQDGDEIKRVVVDQQRGVARVEVEGNEELSSDVLFKRMITSGCGRGASFYSATDVTSQKVESATQVSPAEIRSLVLEFQHRSSTYRATGGVHSAALSDTGSIQVFSEDIGRHNAIDKVFGECLLEGISTDGKIVVTSGRISSEILLKVARRNVPIIVSKSAPTDLGVRLAHDLGITLIGFVRGKRMNVYSNEWRVTDSG